jgi:SpoVK/Ycf46/Vps4 family AAA+-type ATPase
MELEIDLKILQNLLRVRVFKNSILFKEFSFTEDEVAIVKMLTQNFLDGESSISVEEVIVKVFKSRKLDEQIKAIPTIEKLRESGYIEFNSPGLFVFDAVQKIEREKLPYLEMLNANIALTQKFLFLLQGKSDSPYNIDETQPYLSHFQYIEDITKKIKILLDKNLREQYEELFLEIDSKIEKRIQLSDIETPLKGILEEMGLSQKEELIFLAVLGEEYSLFPNSKNLRNVENLIELISFKSYEKLENRSIFREESRVIKEKIFEFETSIHFINEQKSFTNEEVFISEAILEKIEGIKTEGKKEKKSKLKDLVEKQEIFELVEPKRDLSSVILPKETKKILETIVQQLDTKVIERLIKWGLKEKGSGVEARIIFHGVAGTGKTLTATALAKELNKDILHFDASKVLSMYVGESEKNVRSIFDTYKKLVKDSGVEPILFLNEADQFLTARSTDTSSSISQMYNQMQNIFLEQIENFDGVLIATTNLLENLDKAFSRRFNYKVEFKPPSIDERVELWKRHLPKGAEFEKDFSVEKLAEFKLTGGQIDLIVKNSAYSVATLDNPLFKMEHFLKEIEREKNSNFESDRVMGFLK